MFEMKNTLYGVNSKSDNTEKKTSKLEDLSTESIQYETQRGKKAERQNKTKHQ